MKFGVRIPHSGPWASQSLIRDFSQAAEGLGYDSAWTVDHVAPGKRISTPYTLGPQPIQPPDGQLAERMRPLFECLTTMAYVAGVTERVHIGTAVMVLPLRNPVYNARQLATLDALSGGRLILGVGAGWLRDEAEAMQIPWEHRGARTEEHIDVLRTLWTARDPFVSFKGRFYSFEEIDPPHPANAVLPILIGGHSDVAKERAARIGDGWISMDLPADVQAQGVADVRKAAARHGRDPDSLLFFATIRLRRDDGGKLAVKETAERIRGHLQCGTQHIVLFDDAANPYMIETMRTAAEELLPQFRDS